MNGPSTPAQVAIVGVGVLGYYLYSTMTHRDQKPELKRSPQTMVRQVYVGNKRLGEKYAAGSNVVYSNANRHLFTAQLDSVLASPYYLQSF